MDSESQNQLMMSRQAQFSDLSVFFVGGRGCHRMLLYLLAYRTLAKFDSAILCSGIIFISLALPFESFLLFESEG